MVYIVFNSGFWELPAQVAVGECAHELPVAVDDQHASAPLAVSGHGVYVAWFRVQGLGFRVYGAGSRV
jgi:hypothetical protein